MSSDESKNDPALVTLGPIARFALRMFPIEKLLAEVIRRIPPKVKAFYPLVMFNFLNLFRPAVTIEVFIFRNMSNGTEVLFRERGGIDVGWAGTVHAPGSFLLMKETIAEAIVRIVKREVGPQAVVHDTLSAGVLGDTHEERGHHVHLLFIATVTGVDESGSSTIHWFPVDQLPENTVPQHRGMVEMAVSVYLGHIQASVVHEYTP
jgi:ADP-ribose pyrophosphatase YjhB (NUDIX family)